MFTVKWDSFRYSSAQFGIWRCAFGIYLTFYYLSLIPYGSELFSREVWSLEMMGSARHYFPKFLLSLDTPSQVSGILMTSVVCSVLIALGWWRRSAALCLWILVMWQVNRNPYTDSPEYGFINWLIFACIFIPNGERLSLERKKLDWKMPQFFYWGAWLVLGLCYFHAGSHKLKGMSPEWQDGTAMYYVFNTDHARLLWYGDFFDSIPKEFFIPITWGALYSQTLAPIFILFSQVRPWWWLISTGVHFVLFLFLNLAQVSLGMLLFHLFLFDLEWTHALRRYLSKVKK